MPTTAFSYTNAAWTGQFTDAAGVFPYRQFVAVDSSAAVNVTGTQFQLDCYIAGSSGNSYVEYSLDNGVTWTDCTPTGAGNFNQEITLTVYTGLADILRTVLVRTKVAAAFYLNRGGSGCFIVTGAAPAASIPAAYAGTQYIPKNTSADSIGRAGILNNSRLESGFAPTTTPNNYDCVQPATLWCNVGGGTGGTGAQLRFHDTDTDQFILTYCDGSVWQLWIDGVASPTVTAPNTGHMGWVHIGSGLDAGAEHLYGIACTAYTVANITQGSGMIAAVRTQGGTGINTSTRPALRPALWFFGNSIEANLRIDGDASFSFPYRLGNRLNREFKTSAISSTTVHNFASNPGTLSGFGYTAATAYSGEARTSDITGAVPGDIILVMYGTNDLGQAWAGSGAPPETQADFQLSYTSMLTSIVGGIPSGVPVYCVGILPRSSFTGGTIASWNGNITTAMTAVNSPKVEPYVDPVIFSLDVTNDFVDGIHPNHFGAVKIENGLYTLLAPPSFTINLGAAGQPATSALDLANVSLISHVTLGAAGQSATSAWAFFNIDQPVYVHKTGAILVLEKGTSADFLIQVANPDGSDAVHVYNASDTLATSLWDGQQLPVVLHPSTAWTDVDLGQFTITFNDADSAGLNLWGYSLRTVVQRMGRSIAVFHGMLQIEPAPGSTAVPAVYCTLEDVQTYCPQIRKLQDATADLAGFLNQRNRARTWFEELRKDAYRPQYGRSRRYLAADGVNPGPFLTYVVAGPMGQAAPTADQVQTYFDQGGLKLTKKVIEANARMAAALVYGAQPGRDNPYQELARQERAFAAELARTAVVDLDTSNPPDGTYTMRIARDVTWLG